MMRPPPKSTLFPYTPLFRSRLVDLRQGLRVRIQAARVDRHGSTVVPAEPAPERRPGTTRQQVVQRDVGAGEGGRRSEEHTSELQSRQYLVCRLLLEKKKNIH